MRKFGLIAVAAAGIIVSLFAGQAQAVNCTGTPTPVANGGSVTAAFLLTPGNCVAAGDKIFGEFSSSGAITGTGSASFSFTMTPGNVTLGFAGVVGPLAIGSLNYTVGINPDPAVSQGFLIDDLQKDFTLNASDPGLAAFATLAGTTNPASINFNCNRTVNPSGGTCPQTGVFAPVAQLTVNQTLTTGANAIVTALTDTISQVAPTPPRDVRLSDSQEPGSVLIFPLFIGGRSTAGGGVNVDGVLLPRTEIELGVVCPPGVTPTTTVCFEHQTIKVRGRWVCPGSQDIAFKYVCPETSFEVFPSIDGKIVFPADGHDGYFFNQVHVPAPQCKNGYLIMWVVDNAGRAIKFDGLIGDAVLRGPNNAVAGTSVRAGFSTALNAYSAIPIQADPALATGALVSTAGNELHFSGSPGEYLGVTGVLYGDVKFDNEAPAHSGNPTPAGAFSQTFLTFLTLDTNANHPNNPTFVPITFHNESAAGVSTSNPLFENPTDTAVEFICWGRFQLTQIDDNLTQAAQGTRKGIFQAGPAEKFQGPFSGDETGAATLLGLVHTVEGTAANVYQERAYIYLPFNDSVFVETEFEFLPSLD